MQQEEVPAAETPEVYEDAKETLDEEPAPASGSSVDPKPVESSVDSASVQQVVEK